MSPLLMHVIPRSLKGRILSLLLPAMELARLLGTLATGYLASTVFRSFHVMFAGLVFGRTDTLILLSGLITILGGFYAMLQLRDVRSSFVDENVSRL